MENISKIAFGISISSIVITVVSFAVSIAILIWILKKKREPRGSKLFWPYLFLILILIAILVANNRTEYASINEMTMQNIVDETNLILENAENRVNNVSLDELKKSSTDKWFNEKFLYEEIKVDSYREVAFDETEKKIKDYLTIIKKYHPIFEEVVPFVIRINRNPDPDCKIESVELAQEMVENNKKIEKIFVPLLDIPIEIRRRMDLARDDIKNDVDVMKSKDFGSSKIEPDLMKRKTMLTTFKSTISNTETIRKDWVEKIIKTLPDKQTVLKTIIIQASLCHILLSFIILIIMISSKYIPQKIVTIGILFMIIITGILTICLSIYTIILYYQFQQICPLNNYNFGFLNFTSSIPENDRLCQNVNGTFYESLTSEMLNFPNIIQDYNIQQHIDDIKQKTIDKMQQFDFDKDATRLLFASLSINTDVINKTGKAREATGCGMREFVGNTTKILHQNVIDYTGKFQRFEHVLDDYNTFLMTLVNNLMVIFKKPYQKVLKSYTQAVNRIQSKTNATDFPCQVIFDKYSDAGDTICRPFHGKVPLLWIYLIVINLSFTASLIVHVLVLRNLKSGKLQEQQPPSSLPTSTPPPMNV